jgi:hypothetical protein
MDLALFTPLAQDRNDVLDEMFPLAVHVFECTADE